MIKISNFEIESDVENRADFKFYQVNCSIPDIENKIAALIRIDDISELKEKESLILQINKMETVGTLASGLAHDFNNILTGIIGTASLMEMKLEKEHSISSEKMAYYIDVMHATGVRASEIIRQLQTISRGHQVSLSKFDLKKMISQVIGIVKNTLDKSIDVHVNLPEHTAFIIADQGQIEQVLLNLCVNASHAMTIMRGEGEKWGGILEISLDLKNNNDISDIRLKDRGSFWQIVISDTGVGISHETLGKIFDPFFYDKAEGARNRDRAFNGVQYY